MMFDDCRKFLSELERKQKLRKIEVPVDKDWEISCVARLAAELPSADRFAILFKSVRGFRHPVLINAFASREMYAMALGTSVDGIQGAWQSALQNQLEPEQVNSGPCKENVLTGEDADLTIFPHIISTPGKDAGPYITAGCVVTKDPETGTRNVGIYRIMVKGKRKLGIHIAPTNDGSKIYSKYEEMGKPMEIAIAIAPPPAVCMVATTRIPYGTDELAVAGGDMTHVDALFAQARDALQAGRAADAYASLRESALLLGFHEVATSPAEPAANPGAAASQ